jgi:uncharacterized cofD-like protein
VNPVESGARGARKGARAVRNRASASLADGPLARRSTGVSFLDLLKWLYPGMRVKRWCLLALGGVLVALMGTALAYRTRPLDLLAVPNRAWDFLGRMLRFSPERWNAAEWTGGLIAAAGVGLALYAVAKLAQSLTTAVIPAGTPGSLVDVVYRNRFLAHGARVVVLGGGTGLSTMLRGLKQFTSNITAVVTVTDDGGSSGKLTRQLNILPPGDIRNCLVALADSEAAMLDLLQYRFRTAGTGEGLKDHAFGNLLIAAMCDIAGGDFERAVAQTSRVLNIRGRVLPSTLSKVTLKGEMEDGSVLEGETNIATSPLKIRRVFLGTDETQPIDEVIEAIETADVIVAGPGSVYTSVVPNLLVGGIVDALRRSEARKVYICNVMTQKGETDGFSASDHIRAIESHLPRKVFDTVLVNTARPSQDLLEKYRGVGAVLVEPDTDRIKQMGYRAITGNFISQTDVVRHDSLALAQAIMDLLRRG